MPRKQSLRSNDMHDDMQDNMRDNINVTLDTPASNGRTKPGARVHPPDRAHPGEQEQGYEQEQEDIDGEPVPDTARVLIFTETRPTKRQAAARARAVSKPTVAVGTPPTRTAKRPAADHAGRTGPGKKHKTVVGDDASTGAKSDEVQSVDGLPASVAEEPPTAINLFSDSWQDPPAESDQSRATSPSVSAAALAAELAAKQPATAFVHAAAPAASSLSIRAAPSTADHTADVSPPDPAQPADTQPPLEGLRNLPQELVEQKLEEATSERNAVEESLRQLQATEKALKEQKDNARKQAAVAHARSGELTKQIQELHNQCNEAKAAERDAWQSFNQMREKLSRNKQELRKAEDMLADIQDTQGYASVLLHGKHSVPQEVSSDASAVLNGTQSGISLAPARDASDLEDINMVEQQPQTGSVEFAASRPLGIEAPCTDPALEVDELTANAALPPPLPSAVNGVLSKKATSGALPSNP